MNILSKLLAVALCLGALLSEQAYAHGRFFSETVYTLSNDPDHNAVLAFKRNTHGKMEAAG